MFAYNTTPYMILQPYPSAVHLYSILYLTSTLHPLGLPISKAPSPKTYCLKRFTTKRSSPHHVGKSFSVPTNYTPCPNSLIHFLAPKVLRSQRTILHLSYVMLEHLNTHFYWVTICSGFNGYSRIVRAEMLPCVYLYLPS